MTYLSWDKLESRKVSVVRVKEEIVGGREVTIALRTTTTSGDLLAAVEGLPWVGGEHLVGDQVIPLVLSN